MRTEVTTQITTNMTTRTMLKMITNMITKMITNCTQLRPRRERQNKTETNTRICAARSLKTLK